MQKYFAKKYQNLRDKPLKMDFNSQAQFPVGYDLIFVVATGR